jgi:hypothetical protein
MVLLSSQPFPCAQSCPYSLQATKNDDNQAKRNNHVQHSPRLHEPKDWLFGAILIPSPVENMLEVLQPHVGGGEKGSRTVLE